MKIKERLDTLSDAIIAIIITIMVLEMPIEIKNGEINFFGLFQAIGIFIVSFCFVANIWYQHAVAFSEVNEVPNKIIVMDLILMMLLSLMPTFTRLMTSDTVRETVTMYGILYLLIIYLFREIVKEIIHQKYTEKSDMKKVYVTIYGRHNTETGLLILALILIGWFFPKITLVFFIIIPIRSFITNSADNSEFTNISQMEPKGTEAFLEMTPEDREKLKPIITTLRKEIKQQDPDAWENFTEDAEEALDVSEGTILRWFRQYRQAFEDSQNTRRKNKKYGKDQLSREDD
ncbi:TMEM175 family protein [Dellaglioa sp. P0083]|uniref:TMEM175 family protein n=1 Tax=Dellaglioa kimchii TaxID=3344667 RepID=UPI0038D48FAD